MDFYLTTSASTFPCFQINWMVSHGANLDDLKTRKSTGTSCQIEIHFSSITFSLSIIYFGSKFLVDL